MLQNVKRPMPHETQSLESRFPTLSPAAVELLKVGCLSLPLLGAWMLPTPAWQTA